MGDLFAVGVDVGGTDIKCVLMTSAGQPLAELRYPSPDRGPRLVNALLDVVASSVEELRRAAPEPPSAVGVVVPGIVDEKLGLALHSENLGWSDVPMRQLLTDHMGCPVAFGHDVRAAGLAEMRVGAGVGLSDVVTIAIGTGVAAAVFIHGEIYRGSGLAGEIGHLGIGNDELCRCGARGCVEASGSAAAVSRRYAAASGDLVNSAAEVVRRMESGDPVARSVWSDAVCALAVAVSWTAAVLAPEAVILGGGLAAAGLTLLDPLRSAVANRLGRLQSPELLLSSLGPLAGAIGAAFLALDSLPPCAVGSQR